MCFAFTQQHKNTTPSKWKHIRTFIVMSCAICLQPLGHGALARKLHETIPQLQKENAMEENEGRGSDSGCSAVAQDDRIALHIPVALRIMNLGSCSHRFCAACVETFLDVVNNNDTSPMEMNCPLCRMSMLGMVCIETHHCIAECLPSGSCFEEEDVRMDDDDSKEEDEDAHHVTVNVEGCTWRLQHIDTCTTNPVHQQYYEIKLAPKMKRSMDEDSKYGC